MAKSIPCPCGSGLLFSGCCGRYIHDGQPAPDAERLMRSRYSAFATDQQDYLLRSWHPDTRPPGIAHSPGEPVPKWIGLRIVSHRTIDDSHSEVEFVARYRIGGRASRLHETSRFVREDDRWYYIDGTLHES